jgi:hypothetical protein
MLRLRYLLHLLPLAAVAMVMIGSVPSRGETIIDEWQSVKAPPPQLKSVALEGTRCPIVYVQWNFSHRKALAWVRPHIED